jgi:hypothetical protein
MRNSDNVVLATTMEAAAADCRRIIHARYWSQSGINRRVGAFFVMNEFSIGGFNAAVAATNGLIAQLAPR